MTRASRHAALSALFIGSLAIATAANVWGALEHRRAAERMADVQARELDHRAKVELVMQREVEQHARILYQQSLALKAGERLVKMLEGE